MGNKFPFEMCLYLCMPNARDLGRHMKVGVSMEFGFLVPLLFGKVIAPHG